jgi:hypothetical protein
MLAAVQPPVAFQSPLRPFRLETFSTINRPRGTPFNVAHFHSPRHKITEGGFGPGFAAGKLVFTVSGSTGNIWMTKTEPVR